jgi:tetratricopeptide (TPR) repeat protein
LAEAAQSFQRTTDLKPDYALAHFNLGKCLQSQGDAAKAIEALRMALRYKPDFAEAHLSLADLLQQRGEGADAEVHRRHAAALAPLPGGSATTPIAPSVTPAANP